MKLRQKMGEKKHSLRSKRFRVKIGANAKKVHPPQFLSGKKEQKMLQTCGKPDGNACHEG